MKKLSVILSLLSVSSFPGTAQNLMQHFHNATSGMRFEAATNQYVLTGVINPAVLSGMDNTGPAGPLGRIKLQLVDDQLNTLWFKTYVTQTDVNRAIAMQGCRKITSAHYASFVRRTTDGGYIISGLTKQDGEISGCPAVPVYAHPFLLKTNSAGSVMWYKRYNVTGQFNQVIEDAATGRFIACGATIAASSDGLIVGTDATGNVLWSRGAKSPNDHSPGTTLNTGYIEIISFITGGGLPRYAVLGNADQSGFGLDGGILISVIDVNGNFLQDAVVNNDPEHILAHATGIADAGDGKVVITGGAIDASGGFPCGADDGSMIMVKLNPLTLVVDFYKAYNKGMDRSLGGDIEVWRDGPVTKYCVVGNYGSALYMETDDNGNPLRFTVHNPADAVAGGRMTINTVSNYPAYAGAYSGGTFMVRDNYGVDCQPDIPVFVEELPHDAYGSDHYLRSIPAISEVMLDFSFPYTESPACGVLKPGITGIGSVPVKQGLLLSPNPAGNYLHLQLPEGKAGLKAVTVYDILGRILLRQEIMGSAATINIEKLVQGTYVLHAQSQNDEVWHATFVKK